jgi:hypothetical protein
MALYALQTAYASIGRATSQPSPKYSAMLTRAKQQTFRPIFDRRKRAGKCQKLAGALPALCHRWWPARR